MDSCKLISTEYTRNYRKKKYCRLKPILQRDYLAEKVEEGELDPYTASIPSKLDEAAEQLVRKHNLDRLRTTHQVVYKHPFCKEETDIKTKDLENQLLAHIHDLYFNPHDENVLALLATQKRLCGYVRPKLLHATFTTYQDTFARTGARIILEQHKRKNSLNSKERVIKTADMCVDHKTE